MISGQRLEHPDSPSRLARYQSSEILVFSTFSDLGYK